MNNGITLGVRQCTLILSSYTMLKSLYTLYNFRYIHRKRPPQYERSCQRLIIGNQTWSNLEKIWYNCDDCKTKEKVILMNLIRTSVITYILNILWALHIKISAKKSVKINLLTILLHFFFIGCIDSVGTGCSKLSKWLVL